MDGGDDAGYDDFVPTGRRSTQQGRESMNNRITRRRMLQATAAAAVATVAATAADRAYAANSKLQHACIGVGGMMGGGDFGSFLGCKGAEVVAICDVDAGILAAAGSRGASGEEILRLAGNAATRGRPRRFDQCDRARPHARRHYPRRAGKGQARLLPETDGARRVRGAGDDRGRGEVGPRNPVGQPVRLEASASGC